MRAAGGRSLADFLLLGKVALGGLGGGLVATAVLAIGSGPPGIGLLLFIVVVVTVLAVLTVGTLQTGHSDDVPIRTPRDDGWGRQRLTRYAPESQPYARSRGPSGPSGRPQYPSPVRPPRRPGDGRNVADHYAGAGNGPMFPVAPAPAAPPPLDVRPPAWETYDVPGRRRPTGEPVRRVVQCPRCGDFDVVVRRGPDAFAFACRPCRNEWNWAPDRPWPTTVVRPAAARATGPDAGAA